MTPPAAAGAIAGARAGQRARARGLTPPPRRVSGPARGRSARRRTGASRELQRSLPLQTLAALRRLFNHRLLDRLIRGRAWLGLVTFALIGIVTLQLALLKLNGAVGRTLLHEAQLQREDDTLSIENSELAAADHIQRTAAQLGMEFAPASALGALAASPRHDLGRAAGALSSSVPSASQSGEEGAGSSSGAAGSHGGEGTQGEAQGTSGRPPGGEAQAGAEGQAEARAGSQARGESSSQPESQSPAAGPSSAESNASEAPQSGGSAATAPEGSGQAGSSG